MQVFARTSICISDFTDCALPIRNKVHKVEAKNKVRTSRLCKVRSGERLTRATSDRQARTVHNPAKLKGTPCGVDAKKRKKNIVSFIIILGILSFPIVLVYIGWIGSRVVSMLDSGAERPGFKSQPRRCRVTVLGKLVTPIVPLFTKQPNWQPS